MISRINMMAIRLRRHGSLWFDLETPPGAIGALATGTAAAAFMAASHIVGCTLVLLADHDWLGSLPGLSLKLGFFAIYGTAVLVPLALGLLLWLRGSLAAAWGILAWASLEMGFAAAEPSGPGLLVSAAVVVMAANGLRGASAARPAPIVSPEPLPVEAQPA